MLDWFQTAVLERYENLEHDEKIEWLHRFQYQPATSTSDVWVWKSFADGGWHDAFMDLCRDIFEECHDNEFFKMPSCFKTFILHHLEHDMLNEINCWIEDIIDYAKADDIEIMTEEEFRENRKD
jgi:hypothetical protein